MLLWLHEFFLCNGYIYVQSFTDHIVYLTCLDYLNALYTSFNKNSQAILRKGYLFICFP